MQKREDSGNRKNAIRPPRQFLCNVILRAGLRFLSPDPCTHDSQVFHCTNKSLSDKESFRSTASFLLAGWINSRKRPLNFSGIQVTEKSSRRRDMTSRCKRHKGRVCRQCNILPLALTMEYDASCVKTDTYIKKLYDSKFATNILNEFC